LSLDPDTYVDECYVVEWIREIKEASRQRAVISANASALERLESGEPFAEAFRPLTSALGVWSEESGSGIEGIDVSRFFDDAALFCTRPYQPPTFLVEHLVPEQSLILFTGHSGAGKTSFALHTAIALAKGLLVAGAFATNANGRPVLWFNAASEMSEENLRRFMQENAAGLGVTLAEGDIVIAKPETANRLKLGVTRGQAHEFLEAVLKQYKPCLVVFDCMRRFFTIDENQSEQVNSALGLVKEICVRHGTSVLLLHHPRKRNDFDNSAGERIAGSRDIHAISDIHICAASKHGVMTQLELERTRTPVGHVVPGTRWDVDAVRQDGSIPMSTFRFTLHDDSAAQSAADKCREQICNLMAAGPKTRHEVGADSGTGRTVFYKLKDEGRIKQLVDPMTGKKVRKDRRALYVLVDEAASGDDTEASPSLGVEMSDFPN